MTGWGSRWAIVAERCLNMTQGGSKVDSHVHLDFVEQYLACDSWTSPDMGCCCVRIASVVLEILRALHSSGAENSAAGRSLTTRISQRLFSKGSYKYLGVVVFAVASVD